MRMRHVRLLAATGTAVAALALTACGNGTGTEDEGSSQSTAVETDAPRTAEDTAGGTTGGGTGSPGGTAGAVGGTADGKTVTGTHKPGGGSGTSAGQGGQGTGGRGGGSAVLCNGTNTKVTAQLLNRPLNHMLLTVRNTGSKSCDLPYYPVLRFDQMQWVPQPDKETQPQAVVSLAPGESGYAGVLLSAADGSGTGGQTAHKLTLAFQGYTPNSSGGPSAIPALPAKGVYYDSALKVTYWEQDLGLINGW
ncbi:DUF4232 domain-containing protein [Streptomyces echinatus]|uniref:DUF4232 domain-containing protein n=1 Tax=Streptomyces echinatus TaxID=67293 RepID=UPI0037A78376